MEQVTTNCAFTRERAPRQPATEQSPAWKRERLRPQKASALLGLAAVFNLAGNLLFHVAVAHSQNVSVYGEVATLLSFGTGAAMCAAGVQYAVARRAAVSSETLPAQLKRGIWYSSFVLSPAVLIGVFGLMLAKYLHLNGTQAIWAAATYFAVSIVQAVPYGILIGRGRYGWLAAITAGGVLLRLSLIWGTGRLGSSLVGALSVSDLSVVATVIGAVMVVSSVSKGRRRTGFADNAHGAPGIWKDSIWKDSISGAALGALVWVMWLLPLFFAEHYLARAQAGRFAVGQTAAGGILFLCAPIATAFVPTVFRRSSAAREGLFLTALVSATCTLGLWALGHGLIARLYGPGFAPSPLSFLAMAGAGSVVACASYLLWVNPPGFAMRKRFFVLVPVGISMELLSVEVLNVSLLMLAVLPAAAILAGSVVSLLAVRAPSTGQSKAPSRAVRLRDDYVALSECSVGVMTHDEELTIRECLTSLLEAQDRLGDKVHEVVVVVTGTDATADIVADIAESDPRVRMFMQEGVQGKAAAINIFLEKAEKEILVLSSADVVLGEGMLGGLVAPLEDPQIGMCGGEIKPTNPRKGICNRLVRLMWELHSMVAQRRPKLGEVVAFRRCFTMLDEKSTVDEVSIEDMVEGAGLSLVYLPKVRVYNHGPTRLFDFIRHRARNHRGHLAVRLSSGYKAATLSPRAVVRPALAMAVHQPWRLPLLSLAAAIEIVARVWANLAHLVLGPPASGKFRRIPSAKQAFRLPAETNWLEPAELMEVR
jgi:Glycosyl transferase family 2